MDEGVDELVLQELKQIWTNKIMISKAVDLMSDPQEQQTVPPTSQSTKVSFDELITKIECFSFNFTISTRRIVPRRIKLLLLLQLQQPPPLQLQLLTTI